MDRIYDAHAHLGTEEERRWRREQEIVTMICAGSLSEAEVLEHLGDSHIVKAYGLHPWNAEDSALDSMLPFLEQADIIGEIGMDSVWCQVPVKSQRRVLERQLELASAMKKPVVLHVKGMEKEVAGLIRKYPGTYLVHWYSGKEGLEAYLEQGCYATVGPDAAVNEAVRRVIEKTPLSRLMVETDGLGAVQWALGGSIRLQDLRSVLEKSLAYLAEIKGISFREAHEWTGKNFRRFAAGEREGT